ncbi:hypothetical protein [Serratia sp. DD3]|uniref:hypothetical protein n=1 Tax=Serratia sp. DD3 TaxID=1410619 RepID=UPI000414A8E0|nr:hypothetical protein [Serratia sp. DD3]
MTPEEKISPGFTKVTTTAPVNSAELTISLPNGLVSTGLNDRNVTLLSAILRQL